MTGFALARTGGFEYHINPQRFSPKASMLLRHTVFKDQVRSEPIGRPAPDRQRTASDPLPSTAARLGRVAAVVQGKEI